MKYITLFFLFLSFSLSSQKTYPYLYQDSIGKQFVVLTLEQAQKLDNATEFSPILWKDHTSYYTLVDSLCEKKLENKNIQIHELKKNIDTLTIWSSAYIKSYELCKNQVELLHNRTEISDEINKNLKLKIESLEKYSQDQEKQLKRAKKETNLAIIFGILSSVVFFVISL